MIDDKDKDTLELELIEKKEKKAGRPLGKGLKKAASSTDRSTKHREKVLRQMARDAKTWDLPTCKAILKSDIHHLKHDDALHRYAAIKKISLQQHKVMLLSDNIDTIMLLQRNENK